MNNLQITEEKGFRTQNPSSNEIEKRFEYLRNESLQVVLDKSQEAYESWSRLGMKERADIAYQIADSFDERQKELAAIATREMGKSLPAAQGEVKFCGLIFRYFADNAEDLVADKLIKNKGGHKAIIQSRPLGVILGIMPWNFPYYQIARFAAPNLILGNVILLKHAEICPQASLAVEGLLKHSGLPQGVYQNIFATHEQVETVISDSRVQGISVTGSERAGSAIAEVAGRNLKKVVLELGGSDAHIYLDAKNVQSVALQAFNQRMQNMGQSCTSNKRLLVHDDIFDEFVDHVSKAASEMFPGDQLAPARNSYSPLSSEVAAQRVHRQVRHAVEQGAVLHVGGGRPDQPGAWMEPTVLSGIGPEMDIYHEEVFGPVISLYRVKTAEEALAIANSSPYGLGGAVFSEDQELACEIAQQLECGMAKVNIGESGAPDMPFGGIKRSGFGRELGPLGMDEFVNKRLLYINESGLH
ncbi:NAD-dependent succinate-semialdehyde dehydrogenase [Nesterenkonia muleiensis]|uniref:NAD-dependent succinate-semialdehyde dehydrogenase n=1 Tax=Nesterenkonia muleiensis TaxID=2282648 RepID=UPI001EE3C535|nr:NAD-dependent succinate-semialdehyde dehydrogenase [Nesterenkonia muleiensis]